MSEEHFENEYDETLKVILLGEAFTGKTSLINVFIKEKFNEDVTNTTAPSYFSKLVTIEDKTILINMWDTAGQEQFRSMNKIFIKKSNIIIFVYDITRKKTFDELSFWVKYAENIISNDNVLYGVVGNKLDLFDKENEIKESGKEFELVNTEEAKEFADQMGAEFLETSAKENGPAFTTFVEELVEKYVKKYMKDKFSHSQKANKINLNQNQIIPQRKKKCC